MTRPLNIPASAEISPAGCGGEKGKIAVLGYWYLDKHRKLLPFSFKPQAMFAHGSTD